MIAMHISDSESEYVLELSGTVDVRVAIDLQRALMEAISKQKPVAIDCTSVESLDASFLQLLLAAKRTSPRPFHVRASSDSQAIKWFELSGLKPELIGA